MNDEIKNPELCRFLKLAGYKKSEIDAMSMHTRLLHDLRLDGDNMFDTLEILRSEFGVDFSDFNWNRYTPSEGDFLFPKDFLRWSKRLLGKKTKRLEDYEPITLAMIAESIRTKRWPYG